MILALASILNLLKIFSIANSNQVWAFFIAFSLIINANSALNILKLLLSNVFGKFCAIALVLLPLSRTIQSEQLSASHFNLEITSLFALLSGAAVFLSSFKRRSTSGVLREVSIALLISLILFSVALAKGGLQFSTIESGRSYSNADNVSLKNLLYLAIFAFPLYHLARKWEKFTIVTSFLAFLISVLASGGRSFFPIAIYAFICILLDPLLDIKKLRIGKVTVLLSLFSSLILFRYYNSLEFIVQRAAKSSEQFQYYQYRGDARWVELLDYISGLSLDELLLGKGIGSTTNSPLFDGITNTLHVSFGTLLMKAGLLGCVASVGWILWFAKSRKIKIRSSFLVILPPLGWFLCIDVAHTSISSPEAMFYLGYFTAMSYYWTLQDADQRVINPNAIKYIGKPIGIGLK